MKRGFACFLLVLVFVGLVILSKPVMAQNLIQVQAYGPSTYTIMPGSNFTVWVAVSLRVTYSGSCILVILIKTSESAKTGLGHTVNLDETLLDGQPHSQIFELANLLTAPGQEGIWPLYARAYIQDISGYNMVVAESVLTPFSVQIGNSTQTIPFATPSQETIMMFLGLGIACLLLRYRKYPKICVQS